MKRDLFAELVEGFDALRSQRRNKVIHLPYQALAARSPFECAEQRHDFAASEHSGYICPEHRGALMIIVPLAEAKNNLSKLVDDAASGKVITISKHGRAMARLVPVGNPYTKRIGAMKGKLTLPEDFDAPLSDEMLDEFEGTQR